MKIRKRFTATQNLLPKTWRVKNKRQKARNTFDALKQTFRYFVEDDGLNLASSIAFFTIFSLPGVLVFIVYMAGSIFGEDLVKTQLMLQATSLAGPASSEQISELLEHAARHRHGTLASWAGLGTLLFSATTVFISVQDALNRIWGVKPKPKRGVVKFLLNRMLSFALVASFGFLMITSLMVEAVVALFDDFLHQYMASFTWYIVKSLNLAISASFNAILFALIYKLLPDAKIYWTDVWLGALFATACFLLGKFMIGFYIGNSEITTVYGAAGSLVVILIWVYFTSLVLLAGAEFSQVISFRRGKGIYPKKDAVRIEVREIELLPDQVDTDELL
jgi:membrane protein